MLRRRGSGLTQIRLIALGAVLAAGALPATAIAATPGPGTYKGNLDEKVLTVKVRDGKGTVTMACQAGGKRENLGTAQIKNGRLTVKKLKNGIFTVYKVRVTWATKTEAKASFEGLICDGAKASGTITKR